MRDGLREFGLRRRVPRTAPSAVAGAGTASAGELTARALRAAAAGTGLAAAAPLLLPATGALLPGEADHRRPKTVDCTNVPCCEAEQEACV